MFIFSISDGGDALYQILPTSFDNVSADVHPFAACVVGCEPAASRLLLRRPVRFPRPLPNLMPRLVVSSQSTLYTLSADIGRVSLITYDSNVTLRINDIANEATIAERTIVPDEIAADEFQTFSVEFQKSSLDSVSDGSVGIEIFFNGNGVSLPVDNIRATVGTSGLLGGRAPGCAPGCSM